MIKKWILLLALVMGSLVQAQAQETEEAKARALKQDKALPTSRITFVHNAFNFKKIKADEVVIATFYFKNTGTQPLKIYDVQTSCGCTVTDWDKSPVAPDDIGKISVKYTPSLKNQFGRQQKVLLIISNAVNREEKLYLVGEVLK